MTNINHYRVTDSKMTERVFASEYMHWAKTQSRARFNLATSGLGNLSFQDLKVDLTDLEITTNYGYGYPPLVKLLAARMGVAEHSIVTAAGTTFANHLAMAALIDPCDEVLIEQPTYEPLLALARYLGATVKRFARRFEDGFQIDLLDLKERITNRTRLIVLTNLHNPTGVRLENDTLKSIAGFGCRVLVDEVYLETFFNERPACAFHLGPEFVVTSSLTKAFGLSGLRCGWIVAEPSLAERMWRLNDLFSATPVHIGERLSVQAFAQLDQIADRAKSLLARNRVIVNKFLTVREDLEFVWPEAGTIVAPRMHADPDSFFALLREKYETSVVPGRFFEMPSHFRLGYACDTEMLKEGLERLGWALDETSMENGLQ